MERLGDRVHRSHPDAAAHADHVPPLGDMGRTAQRTEHGRQLAADRTLRHQRSCQADPLEDQVDGPRRGIGVGDRQRDAFAVIGVHRDQHELAGPAFRCHRRGFDFHSEYIFRQLLTLQDGIVVTVHGNLPFVSGRRQIGRLRVGFCSKDNDVNIQPVPVFFNLHCYYRRGFAGK